MKSEMQNCINCNKVLYGKYCSHCGQKKIENKDKKIIYFFNELISSLFFADGKILRTFRVVFSKPGELTRAYIDGNRKKYLSPLQMFFFANLLYFIFPVLSTFNTSLSTQMEHLPYSKMVNGVVTEYLEEAELNYQDYRIKYEEKSTEIGKLLLITIVLLQAIALKLIFFKNKKFFFTDFIAASAYFNSIYILFLLILLPGVIGLVVESFNLGEGIRSIWLIDTTFILLILSYLIFFLKNAFQISIRDSLWKGIVLTGLLVPSFIVYRFILFWVTFWVVQ